jgi:oligosaccharyltransferase complex subunit gamma
VLRDGCDCSDRDRSPNANGVHAWLTRQLPEGPHPPIVRPFDYTKLILTTTGVLGVISLVVVLGPFIAPIVQNRNIWAALSLLAVLLFTSGHMFNHIRKVPYVAGDGKGGISYFAGGFQNQFGMETQIIAAICKFSTCHPILVLIQQMVFWHSRP